MILLKGKKLGAWPTVIKGTIVCNLNSPSASNIRFACFALEYGALAMMICYFVLSLISMTINITSDKLMPKPHDAFIRLATSMQY